MHRQRHRAGRAVRRRHRRHRHRRDGHGNRPHPQVGHRLRRQHRRRRRGNYHHRRRRRDGHLPGRPAELRRRRDRGGDHRDVLGELAHQRRRDEEACCLATRRPGAGHRDAERRDAEPADVGYPGPPTAPKRTDCCPPAACAPLASGPPGADRARDRDGPARVPKHRLAAAQEQEQQPVPEPEPARGAPAAPVVVRPVWVQRASAPPGAPL
jgi:hypothetical protein